MSEKVTSFSWCGAKTEIKGLWVYDSGLSDGEIRPLVAQATAAIISRGVTIQSAYEAAQAEADGRQADARALEAWRAAEASLPSTLPERAVLGAA